MGAAESFAQGIPFYNEWIDGWKKEGKRVLGYFCSYIPDEIIAAAGLLPVRMRAVGCTDTPMGDAYMSSTTCSFTRCVLELASKKEYGFLDGLVAYNSCDQVRRLYDNLRFKTPFPYHYFLSVPSTSTDVTFDWYKHELLKFKTDLEAKFGTEITDENLQSAIKTYNEARSLIGQLYELRKRETPPITGVETMNVMLAAVNMPRQAFNDHLSSFLKEAQEREGSSDFKARIMVAGTLLDDPKYIKIIEDLGGLVVTDSLCFGAKTFLGPVDEESPPLDALAARYFSKVACPRMAGSYPGRLDFLLKQIEEFQVDGVIIQRMKFCPMGWGESFMFAKDLKQRGIPYLELEKEYVLSGIGAMKTRVQAFLETIERR
jgi:benzoyl-CoA reductase subunit C